MKVLIVDDHSILRAGIMALLKQESPDIAVLEAADGTQALAIADAHSDLDIVLLDLQMPHLDGRSTLAEFGRRHPGLPVVILTSTEDAGEVRSAISNGALGYVPKSASAKTLVGALNLVMRGDVYIPPFMLDAQDQTVPAKPPERIEVPRLTGRQNDVMRLIERGMSNKLIANQLGLSEKTVKVHVTAILKVLNVVNRTQAASAARTFLRSQEEEG